MRALSRDRDPADCPGDERNLEMMPAARITAVEHWQPAGADAAVGQWAAGGTLITDPCKPGWAGGKRTWGSRLAVRRGIKTNLVFWDTADAMLGGPTGIRIVLL